MKQLSNEESFRWIMDPTVYPIIENSKSTKYSRAIELRKNILNQSSLNEYNSYINIIKRKVFHNTFIREEIKKRIEDYNKYNVLRLYTLNDKNKYGNVVENTNENHQNTLINYIIPHFTKEECEEWVNNEFIDPREKKPLRQNSSIYIELLYTSLQYDIDIQKIESKLILSSSSSNNDNITKKIIDSIRKRLEFIKDNDNLFLNHNIESFDKLLDINTVAPKYVKSKKSFSVSSNTSSSINSLNLDEKRQLRDMILEKRDKNKEINNNLQIKLEKKKQKIIANKELFSSFKTFLDVLNVEVWNGTELINNILDNVNPKDIEEVTNAINIYLDHDSHINNIDNKMYRERILRGLSLDNIRDIVINIIYYIYGQLISPEIFLTTNILSFSRLNQHYNFKKGYIVRKIIYKLDKFIDNYKPKLNNRIKNYFINIIDDVISKNYVEKRIIDDRRDRDLDNNNNYSNYYYRLLYNANIELYQHEYRLPYGKGLLTGKELREYFRKLSDTIYTEEEFKIDDNPLNGFTYEECKKWVMMPVYNPRTFKSILIDSPIYNRLLIISLQYDTKLIPRMITSYGYNLLLSLIEVINIILKEENKTAQTREQLEKYIIDREVEFVKIKEKNNISSNNIVGLKWKDIGTKPPEYGTDITANNKALVDAITIKVKGKPISKSSQEPLAFYVIFTKNELENLNIKKLEIDSFIKIKRHYYAPVIDKKRSYELANTKIVRYEDYYIEGRMYTFIECLKWVRQPNKIPNTDTIIVTDGREYNNIFEQALMYDTNIKPIGITPLGLHFKKQILNNKKRYFRTTILKKKTINNNVNIDDIIVDSEICQRINNIHTLKANNEIDNKYVQFKKKMLDICVKYNGKNECNITNIQKKIKKKFVKSEGKRVFNYYEDSALCSIIIDYFTSDLLLYSRKEQEKFIDNYNVFNIIILEIVDINGILSDRPKEAVDLGGVRREFFTNLFEELFCNDNKEENDKPFIRPENSSSNRYYINPNFKPNEKFKKVLNFVKGKYIRFKNIKTFEKDNDFHIIYEIIGKVLGIVIVNEELGLPKQLSTYILARFINPKETINYYDKLYFYLKDFNDSFVYINMINEKQKEYLNSGYLEMNFNDNYIITKNSIDGDLVTSNNFITFILELSNHIITKNYLHKTESLKSMNKNYESLFKGFNNNLKNFLYNNDISIKTLDILITNKTLDKQSLIELARNLKIKIITIGIRLDDQIKEEKVAELKTYMTNIITKKREGETNAEHYDFIKKLLQFWTGFNYYNKKADETDGGYKISYIYHGENIKADYWPVAHTCFYQLDIYGYGDKTTPQEKEDFLYMNLNNSIKGAQGMNIQ
jgi:hypothetical protein